MSPESISGNKYDNKTDIWSLGITVIEMIECKLPFEGMNIMQAIGAIVNDAPPTLSSNKHSTELTSFISECLTKDPAKRKSAFELLMVTRYL
jgi:serine/threonine protein kinase